MPQIHRFDMKNFASNKKINGENPPHSKVYFSETNEKLGAGIFSGVSNLITPAIELIKGNKDLIIEGAKGAAALGSVANAVSKVADAVNEDKKLKELETIRELRKQQEEKSAKNSKNLNSETKKKIASLKTPSSASLSVLKGDGLYLNPPKSGDGLDLTSKAGDGFVKF